MRSPRGEPLVRGYYIGIQSEQYVVKFCIMIHIQSSDPILRTTTPNIHLFHINTKYNCGLIRQITGEVSQSAYPPFGQVSESA
jgi:hypothetical protein